MIKLSRLSDSKSTPAHIYIIVTMGYIGANVSRVFRKKTRELERQLPVRAEDETRFAYQPYLYYCYDGGNWREFLAGFGGEDTRFGASPARESRG